MTQTMRWGDLIVSGDARRREIRARHHDGVDSVEVDGRRLTVSFMERAPEGVSHRNVRVEGPRGSVAVHAVDVRRHAPADSELEDRLLIELDRTGSAGFYVLRLVEVAPDGRPGRSPLRGLDPRYAQASFRFDVDAPSPPIRSGPPVDPPSSDDISYLGRDYEGLRQLIFDRLTITLPAWSEQHIPDVFVTLIELLAYLGDDLSYYEDAVATEAYLQTARQRISVRRHARLVDYRLHEGCQARAWICLTVNAIVKLPLEDVRFAAAGALVSPDTAIVAPGADLSTIQQYTPLPVRLTTPDRATPRSPTVQLRPAHNAIGLWTWGEPTAQLVTGATSATLVDPSPRRRARALALAPGDVLVLEETADPATDGLGPPDPRHRQAVRLSGVRELDDELYEQRLLEVTWGSEDALTFALSASADGQVCAVARGNTVLVGHGVLINEALSGDALSRPGLTFSTPFPDPVTVADHQARYLRELFDDWWTRCERWWLAAIQGKPLSHHAREELRAVLGAEELARLGLAADDADGDGDAGERAARDALALVELSMLADRLLAARRRRLEVLAALAEASGPLDETLVAELTADWGTELTARLRPNWPGSWGPASTALTQDPRAALPLLTLSDGAVDWPARLDLIGLDPTDRAVVAEIDDTGRAGLRLNGPPQDGDLEATYTVGNGTAGNASAEAINAILSTGAASAGILGAVTDVRNPLPAAGGIDPEAIEAARLAIGGAYLQAQPRALVPSDYAAYAASLSGVGDAAAQARASGSLTMIEVAVAPSHGEDPSPRLLADVDRALTAVRRIGHQVRVRAPEYRPIVVTVAVALVADAVRATVSTELESLLASGWRPDGTPALFNPVNVTFGQAVYASALVAAIHGVPGVAGVTLTHLGFVGDPAPTTSAGPPELLTVGALEIVRLDNDPLAPQRGYATFSLRGGR
jgi:predicted phage baseplate assembly protein